MNEVAHLKTVASIETPIDPPAEAGTTYAGGAPVRSSAFRRGGLRMGNELRVLNQADHLKTIRSVETPNASPAEAGTTYVGESSPVRSSAFRRGAL